MYVKESIVKQSAARLDKIGYKLYTYDVIEFEGERYCPIEISRKNGFKGIEPEISEDMMSRYDKPAFYLSTSSNGSELNLEEFAEYLERMKQLVVVLDELERNAISDGDARGIH